MKKQSFVNDKKQLNTTETAINDEGIKYIFRPYITLRNGQILWAYQRGKKAFKIPIG